MVTNGHHQNNFDLIRLLAALQVTVGHGLYWLKIVPVDHWIFVTLIRPFPGVAIFFVVSGFLVTRSYIGGSGRLLPFFCRRALRIYPALWLQFVFVFVLMATTAGFEISALADGRFYKWIFFAFILGSDFYANALTMYSPFQWSGLYKSYPADVLWTIPVELGFYVLTPIVFSQPVARRKLTGLFVFLLFVVSVLVDFLAGPLLRNYGHLNSTGMLASSPAPYFWIFLCGAAVALYWEKVRHMFEGQVIWWSAFYLIGAAFDHYITGNIDLRFRYPEILTIPRTILLAGVVISFAYSWKGLSNWMRGVDLSYGLYLLHLPVIYTFYYCGVTEDLSILFISLAIAIGLAALSFFGVERRAMRWKPLVEAGAVRVSQLLRLA